MYVVKRNGEKEAAQFEKITKRIEHLSGGLDKDYVDPSSIAQKVIAEVKPGIHTYELDEIAARVCTSNATQHTDFSILAGRICIDNLHKNTPSTVTDYVNKATSHRHHSTDAPVPLLSNEVTSFMLKHKDRIDHELDFERDFRIEFFGYKTLEKSYLLRTSDNVVFERPQFLYMREAVQLNLDSIDRAIETYYWLSEHYYTHATPTMFNAGTPHPQMSSCFVLYMKGDSIEGIYDTLKDCACISKFAGGIGLAVHNIRASGSYIAGTQGYSNGLVPMLTVYNNTARYVDQGGGKRKGSFAIYLEPWHPDIMEFLDLKRNHGKEERRARDLHYAMWVPDLFMKRVEENGEWSLFCPSKTPADLPKLPEVYGEEFERAYLEMERRGLAVKTMRAQQIYDKIIDLQTETGEPYMLFKDHVNNKSNQKNIGIIHSSNLCAEITLHTSADETAVCNLASIALPRFVEDGVFNFDKLVRVTRLVTRNVNRVIDVGFYPTVEARRSNMRHRPIGLGVQGLADVFILLRLPFDSVEAKALNKEIFESIYYGAVLESCELAKDEGPYETFAGSPLSEGKFQFDLWSEFSGKVTLCGRYDWDTLRDDVMKHGVRNSTLIALMPTASTAQIMGNTEGVEPVTTNVMNRRVLAGEFPVLNKHLLKDLVSAGLWNKEIRNEIMRNGGSIQNIAGIPQDLKDLYKTVWEIRQSQLMVMAAERGPFVCQSQSLNIHMDRATVAKIATHHMRAWKAGLKTSIYYLRTKGHVMQNKFTVRHPSTDTIGTTPLKIHSRGLLPPPPSVDSEDLVEGDDICLNCGS